MAKSLSCRWRKFTIDFPLPPSINFRYILARAVVVLVVVEGATLGLFVLISAESVQLNIFDEPGP